MDRSMLTISIPTYNRFAFLDWTLTKTHKDFPNCEIVVSDNCSTDDTRTVQTRPNVKYLAQQRNIGAFPNFRDALLAGTSKYVCYLGDDDYLLPDQVEKGIQYLEDHPGVLAYYAPCQLYNEVEQKPEWNAFYVAQNETFHDPVKLWNFLIHNHVWPEHAIFRREGLERILQPRERAYWAFVDVANAFNNGPIHFASSPYYRNITVHPVGHRSKLGDEQCLTDFDEYRAGLEVCAAELFKGRLNDDLKAKLRPMIQAFINARLAVAHKLLTMQGRQSWADSIEKRLQICA